MGRLSGRVSMDQPLMFHKKIYAAIRERNQDGARNAMHEHIIDARDLLRRSQTTP
jgi:DNA-binding FadR family transcriptional regulator